jgi:hypothetical protein
MGADKKTDAGSSRGDHGPNTDTIIDISAQLSHEIVDGAKDRANEIIHLPLMVLRFFANPFRFVRTAPDLKTVTWIVLAAASGILGAVVNGILHQSIFRFIIALLIFPVGAFLAVFALTSLLKVAFRSVHGIRFRYRSGATIFAFSNLFWWISVGAAEKLPPLAIIGFFTALIVAAVGFVEKLQLPKPLVLRWFALLAAIDMVLWSLERWVSG